MNVDAAWGELENFNRADGTSRECSSGGAEDAAEIARLASLDLIVYDREREAAAKRMGHSCLDAGRSSSGRASEA